MIHFQKNKFYEYYSHFREVITDCLQDALHYTVKMLQNNYME